MILADFGIKNKPIRYKNWQPLFFSMSYLPYPINKYKIDNSITNYKIFADLPSLDHITNCYYNTPIDAINAINKYLCELKCDIEKRINENENHLVSYEEDNKTLIKDPLANEPGSYAYYTLIGNSFAVERIMSLISTLRKNLTNINVLLSELNDMSMYFKSIKN